MENHHLSPVNAIKKAGIFQPAMYGLPECNHQQWHNVTSSSKLNQPKLQRSKQLCSNVGEWKVTEVGQPRGFR